MIAEDVYDAIITYLGIYRPEYLAGFFREHGKERTENDIEYTTWEALWNLMNSIAPRGYYFGARISDGCDYGLW